MASVLQVDARYKTLQKYNTDNTNNWNLTVRPVGFFIAEVNTVKRGIWVSVFVYINMLVVHTNLAEFTEHAVHGKANTIADVTPH